MLRVTRNMSFSANILVRHLQGFLPGDWRVDFKAGNGRKSAPDGYITLHSPGDRDIHLNVVWKEHFEPRHIDSVVATLSNGENAGYGMLLAAPVLSARACEVLDECDVSYLDLAGNAHIDISDPLILIDRKAEKASVVRGVERRRTLRGGITGRLIRYLCDHKPPYGIRDIAMDTNVNAGSVSRLIEFLAREAYVQRSGRQPIVAVSWEKLLMRWSKDLAVDREAAVFLEPRGIAATIEKLDRLGTHAITGQFAAARLAPIAPSVALDIYVRDIDGAREQLGLRPSESIGNVRLIAAFDEVVFERTIERDGQVLVSPSQIAADLPTLPHRSVDEYEGLINWMKRHEDDWRY